VTCSCGKSSCKRSAVHRLMIELCTEHARELISRARMFGYNVKHARLGETKHGESEDDGTGGCRGGDSD
jgi:hypothetical protein